MRSGLAFVFAACLFAITCSGQARASYINADVIAAKSDLSYRLPSNLAAASEGFGCAVAATENGDGETPAPDQGDGSIAHSKRQLALLALSMARPSRSSGAGSTSGGHDSGASQTPYLTSMVLADLLLIEFKLPPQNSNYEKYSTSRLFRPPRLS